MLYDAQAFAPKDRYDVAIIGAGAVGLCMATTLAKRGRSVVVLEAGPKLPIHSKNLHSARSIGHPLPGLHLGRMECLGGTTRVWGGQLRQITPDIFDTPRDMPNWPLTSATLAPYYARAYELLGLKTLLSDEEIWARLTLTPPKDPDIAFSFMHWCPEPNLAHLFKDALTAPNLSVVLNAPVKALGPEVLTQEHSITARHTVLAAGTIETVRLLLRPARHNRAQPWASNPNLGRYFFDHVDCTCARITPSNHFHALFENTRLEGLKYSPKMILREDGLEIGAHILFSDPDRHLDALKTFIKGILRGRVAQNPLRALKGLRFAIPMALHYLRTQRILSRGDIFLRLTAEQRPLRGSEITLRDEAALPVDVNWQIAPDMGGTLLKAALRLKDFLEKNGLGQVVLEPGFTTDPLAHIDDANHHMGGARMGHTAEDGVTDTWGRVFGTDGLFVAGAATFPSSGFANPTLTAIALGLRLCDHLEEADQ